jgi:hypothetical protein
MVGDDFASWPVRNVTVDRVTTESSRAALGRAARPTAVCRGTADARIKQGIVCDSYRQCESTEHTAAKVSGMQCSSPGQAPGKIAAVIRRGGRGSRDHRGAAMLHNSRGDFAGRLFAARQCSSLRGCAFPSWGGRRPPRWRIIVGGESRRNSGGPLPMARSGSRQQGTGSRVQFGAIRAGWPIDYLRAVAGGTPPSADAASGQRRFRGPPTARIGVTSR